MPEAFLQLRYLATAATLRGPESLIGRSVYCTIIIPNPSISRIHASITRENGGTFVRDLGSRNGTTVNGTRIGAQPVPLRPGDVLTLGDLRCIVEPCAPGPRNVATTDRPSAPDYEDSDSTTKIMIAGRGHPDGQ